MDTMQTTTPQPSPLAPVPAPREARVRTRTSSAEGTATFIGAAAAAIGLVWIIYERVLPFTGVLGFWATWYVIFLAVYFVMARMQWDALDARNRLASVGFATGGVLALLIVVDQVGYTLFKGGGAVSARQLLDPVAGIRGPANDPDDCRWGVSRHRRLA